MSERTEILSLRLTAKELQQLSDALGRVNSVAQAAGLPTKTISAWARDTLLKGTEAVAVSPSQTINVRVEPFPGPSLTDIAAALRLTLAAVEGSSS